MEHAEVLTRLLDQKIVAVVRLAEGYDLVGIAGALADGGVEAVELTMTTPGALEGIARVRRELGNKVVIGAGTVLTEGEVDQALAVGAQFIVSPTTDAAVITRARSTSTVVIPGALTPTELHTAMTLGADIIKLFPGRVATPGFFRDVLGPFPGARLMPTGNVDLETAPQYLSAGAVAVGVGKALVDPEAARVGDWHDITSRAAAFVNVLQSPVKA